MRILMVMRHATYIRNFESTIRLLAARGHDLQLGFIHPTSKSLCDEAGLRTSLSQEFPNLTTENLPRRADCWRPLADELRTLRDYLRFLEPCYRKATALAERVKARLNLPWEALQWTPLLGSAWGRALTGRLLGLLEAAIPCDSRIKQAIRDFRPDVLLVTLQVDVPSEQLDYVKCARRMGVRAGYCVASWDNLTNKGLVKIPPDLVFVWNEALKREAVELHGVPADRVVVTGAHLYDHWFHMRPSRTREEFARELGLPQGRTILLYLCSSGFIGRNETGFVRRWLKQLRSCACPELRDAAVVVRPHVQNARPWADVDLSDLGDVAIWPRQGALPVIPDAKRDYFDTLYHCAAVVGINTSAMIEAGILGKPSFTITDPEFAHSQEGTLHFSHLADSGFLSVASSLPEHFHQLEQVLCSSTVHREHAVRSFIQDFVRPHGLDKDATPFMVDAIEGLSRAEPLPRPRDWWLWPLTVFLFTMIVMWNGITAGWRITSRAVVRVTGRMPKKTRRPKPSPKRGAALQPARPHAGQPAETCRP